MNVVFYQNTHMMHSAYTDMHDSINPRKCKMDKREMNRQVPHIQAIRYTHPSSFGNLPHKMLFLLVPVLPPVYASLFRILYVILHKYKYFFIRIIITNGK